MNHQFVIYKWSHVSDKTTKPWTSMGNLLKAYSMGEEIDTSPKIGLMKVLKPRKLPLYISQATWIDWFKQLNNTGLRHILNMCFSASE